MFQQVGRRLAILNALVVISILALVGLVTFLSLRRALDAEVDSSLYSRLEGVSESAFDREEGLRERLEDEDEDHDDEEDEDEDEEDEDDDFAIEALTSGDTIIMIVSGDGRIVYNPRGVEFPELPIQDAVDRALAGESDTRSVTMDDVGSMRVVTVPVMDDGDVIGAAQGLQSLEEHEEELALVRWITIFGIGIGMLTAVPAGLYLAQRAMRPINQSFERQRAFVADASHELRTPLTLIRANAEYALQEADSTVDEVRPELTGILDEVDRTDRLVDDLLLLARADEGRLTLWREYWVLVELLERAIERTRPLASDHDLQTSWNLRGDEQVLADEDRVIQAIRILIDNATKYTPAGSRILVEAHTANREAQISVQDNGPGMEPDEAERIFDRFYRVDKARSRSMGGTGLGLSIARALIEAHGGRIWLESTPDAGTTVTFTLPLEA